MIVNNPAKRLAMKIISGVTFLLVFMGMMAGPRDPNADRERPPPR